MSQSSGIPPFPHPRFPILHDGGLSVLFGSSMLRMESLCQQWQVARRTGLVQGRQGTRVGARSSGRSGFGLGKDRPREWAPTGGSRHARRSPVLRANGVWLGQDRPREWAPQGGVQRGCPWILCADQIHRERRGTSFSRSGTRVTRVVTRRLARVILRQDRCDIQASIVSAGCTRCLAGCLAATCSRPCRSGTGRRHKT